MSNLTGNYKISAGEVQGGVDVVREQERRARLQLLDEIREPSPQPIFGEPVKVELEDETSRRIKNTLGDFTQVLKDDAKNLIGISRPTSTSCHGSAPPRVQQAAKKPSTVNGLPKPSSTAPPKVGRLPYSKPIRPEPPPVLKPFYPTPGPVPPPPESSRAWDVNNKDLKRPRDGSSSSEAHCNPATSLGKPGTGRPPANASMLSTLPKYGETTSAPPPKRPLLRPCMFSYPDRKLEKPVEPIEVETILREMQQAVPPPLTAIQTPRTEESGFAFRAESKEELPCGKLDEKPDGIDIVPSPTPEQKPKDSYYCQTAPPSSTLERPAQKHSSPQPQQVLALQVVAPLTQQMHIVQPQIHASQPLQCHVPEQSHFHVPQQFHVPQPQQIIASQTPPAPASQPQQFLAPQTKFPAKVDANGLVPADKVDASKCTPSSLQEDLEVSDSDDEVAEIKKAATDALNSPVKSSVTTEPPGSTSAVTPSNMDVPPTPASNSSSSESGDSDSDDSSSESNDSDSSASSEHSDADTPSKMWGLSNFFDDTRRNQSPAFLPLDTSTNSSTAVKEEPMLVPADERENYCLVDDDSVNGILRGYNDDLKDYLTDPITDTITEFLELDAPVIRSEVLSPILSPLHSSVPAAPPVRGPRTPPTPSYPIKEETAENNENHIITENKKNDLTLPAELSHFLSPLPPPPLPSSQTNKQSDSQQNKCDSSEEKNRVHNDKVKNQMRINKPKSETCNSKRQSSPVVQSVDHNNSEPSASKGLPNVSEKESDDVVTNLSASSSSVPSEKSESAHENYTIKTRQKISTSNLTNKKNKSISKGNINDGGQKSNTSSLKPNAVKMKHPTRACRLSSEMKQEVKPAVILAKQETKGDPKKRLKAEAKTNVESSTKNKNIKPMRMSESASKSVCKVKKISKCSKESLDVKKPEVKKKRKKFAIENFLQDPTITQTESISRIQATDSLCPGKSPVVDSKKDSADNIKVPPGLQSQSSKSPSRTSKSAEKIKVEKLRRSVRCSERASSVQVDSSTASGQNTGSKKQNTRKSSKSSIENLPIHMEPPPQLLSPIPQDSPLPNTASECAIPFKIMVCIPLDKITRLPSVIGAIDPENKIFKSKSCTLNVPEVDKKGHKQTIVWDKTAVKKRVNKFTKDFKDKPRTVPSSKSSKNNKANLTKEKSSKCESQTLPIKSKTVSNLNTKSSIKSTLDKTSLDNFDNKITKKRKISDEKQLFKKKPKLSSRTSEEKKGKEQTAVSKNDLVNQTEGSYKAKTLERCDSASSLSSLCSQQSQRSSKSVKGKTKDPSSNLTESKRLKAHTPLLSVKDIKQEKEDKPKVHVKKEPGISTTIKPKQKPHDKLAVTDAECEEKCGELLFWNDSLNMSSQYCHWEALCAEESKAQLSNQSLMKTLNRDNKLHWDHFSSEMHKELKEATTLNKHNNQTPIMPMDYFWTEGQKIRQQADKEKDPLVQIHKYFEATVLFILTSQQREEYSKEPDSVYQFYTETLKFSAIITENVRKLQSCPGSSEFKLLILCLKCQSLLYVKLYSLKIKEIKEKLKGVSDFFLHHCPNATSSSFRNSTHSSPHQSRISSVPPNAPSYSPTPSPASSVTSQTSGYCSSDIGSTHMRSSLPQLVNVPQSMLDMICRQHNHLFHLHLGHDLWEQADMYMTRSNLREFFKEVADQSEPLTLHSSIKELVNYIQKGLSLVKKCPR